MWARTGMAADLRTRQRGFDSLRVHIKSLTNLLTKCKLMKFLGRPNA